eukprot:m.824097 g.824097  ORF g.824097 m.824097 type:complete len:230 (+) comp59404_c0_seq2:223-912(+)
MAEMLRRRAYTTCLLTLALVLRLPSTLAVPIARATFSGGPITGTVTFTAINTTAATVALTLSGLQNGNLSYFIATNSPGAGGECTGVSTIFNPLGASLAACNLSALQTDCAVGQLSARHGTIHSVASVSLSYTDANMPVAGTNSIANNHALTIAHSSNDSIVACAAIVFQCITCPASQYNPCLFLCIESPPFHRHSAASCWTAGQRSVCQLDSLRSLLAIRVRCALGQH